jgi:hypothetical protein
MKRLQKALATSLAVMLMGTLSTATWADDTTNTITNKSTTNVHGSTTVDGLAKTGDELTPDAYGIYYTVVIPQTVHLTKEDGTAGEGDYSSTFTISATGDIGEGQALVVIPAPTTDAESGKTTIGTVELAGSGYARGTAECKIGTNTPNTLKAYYDRYDLLLADEVDGKEEDGASTEYEAYAADLTPGDWTGYMDVDIALCDIDDVQSFFLDSKVVVIPWPHDSSTITLKTDNNTNQ